MSNPDTPNDESKKPLVLSGTTLSERVRRLPDKLREAAARLRAVTDRTRSRLDALLGRETTEYNDEIWAVGDAGISVDRGDGQGNVGLVSGAASIDDQQPAVVVQVDEPERDVVAFGDVTEDDEDADREGEALRGGLNDPTFDADSEEDEFDECFDTSEPVDGEDPWERHTYDDPVLTTGGDDTDTTDEATDGPDTGPDDSQVPVVVEQGDSWSEKARAARESSIQALQAFFGAAGAYVEHIKEALERRRNQGKQAAEGGDQAPDTTDETPAGDDSGSRFDTFRKSLENRWGNLRTMFPRKESAEVAKTPELREVFFREIIKKLREPFEERLIDPNFFRFYGVHTVYGNEIYEILSKIAKDGFDVDLNLSGGRPGDEENPLRDQVEGYVCYWLHEANKGENDARVRYCLDKAIRHFASIIGEQSKDPELVFTFDTKPVAYMKRFVSVITKPRVGLPLAALLFATGALIELASYDPSDEGSSSPSVAELADADDGEADVTSSEPVPVPEPTPEPVPTVEPSGDPVAGTTGVVGAWVSREDGAIIDCSDFDLGPGKSVLAVDIQCRHNGPRLLELAACNSGGEMVEVRYEGRQNNIGLLHEDDDARANLFEGTEGEFGRKQPFLDFGSGGALLETHSFTSFPENQSAAELCEGLDLEVDDNRWVVYLPGAR